MNQTSKFYIYFKDDLENDTLLCDIMPKPLSQEEKQKEPEIIEELVYQHPDYTQEEANKFNQKREEEEYYDGEHSYFDNMFRSSPSFTFMFSFSKTFNCDISYRIWYNYSNIHPRHAFIMYYKDQPDKKFLCDMVKKPNDTHIWKPIKSNFNNQKEEEK